MWLTISTERFQLEGFHRENFGVFDFWCFFLVFAY